ncbi:MAG: hypothetical protein PHE55_00860 [Methylococcaceae bacterium]|nr:hypothetical protein [Methylococcaceae bacterium]
MNQNERNIFETAIEATCTHLGDAVSASHGAEPNRALADLEKAQTVLGGMIESFKLRINGEHAGRREATAELRQRASRRLFGLLADLASEKAHLEGRGRTVEALRAELIKKGLSHELAAQQIPHLGDDEISASTARQAALQAEIDKLGQFLGDEPHFRVELLEGTTLEAA